jgi:hypothetical protein
MIEATRWLYDPKTKRKHWPFTVSIDKTMDLRAKEEIYQGKKFPTASDYVDNAITKKPSNRWAIARSRVFNCKKVYSI